MLVNVLSFGINWWTRCVRDSGDPAPRKNAYYNSTGVRCGGKIRRHWITPGLIRLNGVLGFDPSQAHRAVGQTFVCSDLKYALGGNRLLLKSKSAKSAIPDHYLVTVSSEEHGAINFASSVWKSIFSLVIAASQLREAQEAMLLMNAGDWLQTDRGFWQLRVALGTGEHAALVRIGASMTFPS
jgi:hypothetical protein